MHNKSFCEHVPGVCMELQGEAKEQTHVRNMLICRGFPSLTMRAARMRADLPAGLHPKAPGGGG